MSVRVQREDFDLGAEVTALRRGNAAVGAVASFIGTVRDASGGTAVSAMELEHYPGMTEKALAAIEEAARQRWPCSASPSCTGSGPAAAGPDRAGRRGIGAPR